MISKTALLTAYYRTLVNYDYNHQGFGSDYLANYFLPFHVRLLLRSRKIRDKSRKRFQTRMPGVFEYVMARTAFFDDVFCTALNESIPQIVILGAGYDTRARRFASLNKGTRIFELDSAATQNRKRKLFEKNQIETPEQVDSIPIDFNSQSLEEVIENAGYANEQKTVFILEGVSMYLDPEAVDRLLGFIANLPNRESVIVLDYVITISDDNSHNYYGAVKMRQLIRNHSSRESFRFSIDEEKADSFFNQRGLKIVTHWNHEQIEELLLKSKEVELGQPNGIFRFVIASPDLT